MKQVISVFLLCRFLLALFALGYPPISFLANMESISSLGQALYLRDADVPQCMVMYDFKWVAAHGNV